MGTTSSAEQSPVKQEKLRQVVLPIRPRLRWKSGEGYSAECCIQTAALYYGCYVSQEVCRNVVGNQKVFPGSKGQGAVNVLQKIGMTCERWDETNCEKTSAFLGWMKKHVISGHPVLMCLYKPQGRYKEYDHTVLSTGIYTSNGIKNVADHSDVVVFNDGVDSEVQERQVCTLCDDRKMINNGYQYGYCLPSDNQNYGIAVTGNNSSSKNTMPVRIEIIGNIKEPNFTKPIDPRKRAEQPQILELVVTVYNIKIGKRYAMYKSTNYNSRSFEGEGKKPFKVFVVDKNNCRSDLENGVLKYNYSIIDTTSSDAFVCFRCLLVQEN